MSMMVLSRFSVPPSLSLLIRLLSTPPPYPPTATSPYLPGITDWPTDSMRQICSKLTTMGVSSR